MKIRPARRDDDFQAVAQLYDDVWQVTYAGLLPATFLSQLSPATWHPERRWQLMWLAFSDTNHLVGTCAAGPARAPDHAGWGEIYSIYVRPSAQHQGVGRQLMAAALAKLVPLHAPIYLEVLATNQAAQTFYRQLGFQQKGTVQTRTVPQGQLSVVEMVWHQD